MKRVLIKKIRLAGAVLGLHLLSGTVTALQISSTSSPDGLIPDGSLNGLVDTIALSTSIASITDITVTLNVEGGYNGDYYAYLRHSDSGGTAFSILLNRIGVSGIDAFGSADTGLNVTLNDAQQSNVHDATAAGGVLTGNYRADGRNIDPLANPLLFETTVPSTLLSSFQGMDPNGTWQLFVADVSSGSTGTLKSWGLTITGAGSAVPDGGWTLLSLGAGFGLLLVSRKRPGATSTN